MKQEFKKLPHNKKIIGYVYGEGDTVLDIANLPFSQLTHLVYAFAIPTADGRILPFSNPHQIHQLIKQAHLHKVAVLFAVGGWSYQDKRLEPVFAKATESKEKMATLVQDILQCCEEYHFDGVDIDWEYPQPSTPSAQQYTQFMTMLKEALQKKDKVLTTAVIAGVDYQSGTPQAESAGQSKEALDLVDWVHIMAYDGGDGCAHSQYEYAIQCAAYWHEIRHIPAEKLILGVPFYGRPNWHTYKNILALDDANSQKDRVEIDGVLVHYNGIPTIKAKTRYAKDHLGGIMVWEICQDTRGSQSLIHAIYEEMK